MGMANAKAVESIPGTVTMTDGTLRDAYKNTYNVVIFANDGSFKTVQDVRIEFRLFGNINNTRGNGWRKTSAKQASTFTAN